MKIKNETSEVQINILRRSNSNTEDYWDGNWLEAEIRIQVRGFSCIYGTNLRADDFEKFYSDILMLNSGNNKEIEFTTMEEGLYLHLTAEPYGRIRCSGKGKDDASNSLEFNFEIDLMSLDSIIAELKTLLKLYPVIRSV